MDLFPCQLERFWEIQIQFLDDQILQQKKSPKIEKLSLFDRYSDIWFVTTPIILYLVYSVVLELLGYIINHYHFNGSLNSKNRDYT